MWFYAIGAKKGSGGEAGEMRCRPLKAKGKTASLPLQSRTTVGDADEASMVACAAAGGMAGERKEGKNGERGGGERKATVSRTKNASEAQLLLARARSRCSRTTMLAE